MARKRGKKSVGAINSDNKDIIASTFEVSDGKIISKPKEDSNQISNDAKTSIFIALSSEVTGNKGLLTLIVESFQISQLNATLELIGDKPEDAKQYIIVSASNEKDSLSVEGEHLNYLKVKKSDGKRAEFVYSERHTFKGWSDNQKSKNSFWLPCEEVELLMSMLEHVRTPSAKKLQPYLEHLPPQKQTLVCAQTHFINALRIAGIIETVLPLHGLGREKVWKSGRFSLLAPVKELHEYFGSEVTFYFAWMNFFTTWLTVPAVVGLGVYAHRIHFGYSLDNHPLLPLFSLFMVFWAILFTKFWKRASASWASAWNTSSEKEDEEMRPEHFGELVISPVTQKSVLYYPEYRRIPSYVLSLFVTSAFLAIAFGVMICSLNLQGYIKGDSYTEKLFKVEPLSKLSDPGGMLDPMSDYACYLPVVLHVAVITALNMCYQSIAHWLTNLENPAFEQEYQNSVILKRFFFESFDCYIALFYIAFFQLDVSRLRTELMSLYYTDSFRRVAIECVMPTVIRALSHKMKKKEKLPELTPSDRLRDDFDLPEYEQFDDYLEMVIEFGFITLFASSFPLCALLSMCCNVVEIKSDVYKLCWVVQRPMSNRTKDIGIWQGIIEVQAWMAILTNVLIFGVTSDQLSVWFPSLFDLTTKQALEPQWVVITMVSIEHVIVVIALALYKMIPDVPESVETEQKRLVHAKAELVRLARGKKLL